MVNGWCFGGAIMPLVSCDLAIAADDATFGISEINWAGLDGVSRKPEKGEATPELAVAILEAARKPLSNALAPPNVVGDCERV
jgi:hypothetical protein